MRLLTTFALTAGFSGIAVAHSLPEGAHPVAQLAHQLFDLHHLPALVLMIVAGLLLLQRRRQARKSASKIVNP